MKHTFRVFALELDEAQKMFEKVAAHCYVLQDRLAYNSDGSLTVSFKKSDLKRDVYFVEVVGDVGLLSEILPEEDFSEDQLFNRSDFKLREEIAAMYSYYDSVL